MGKLKKMCGLLVAIIILLSRSITPMAETKLLPIDVVFVLDVSLSMITADPYRLANSAMNMFIDKLTLDRDRVGIVAYAGVITHHSPLTLLTEENKKELQQVIYQLEYASWTDHPLGLLEAVSIIQAGYTEGRQPIIIFLTDGNFNINPFGARTESQAAYDKATALAIAQEINIPIYSIGLNFDGALDRRYIDIVAMETGGISFETTASYHLPDILNNIFYLMIHEAIESAISLYDQESLDEELYMYEPSIVVEETDSSLYSAQAQTQGQGRGLTAVLAAIAVMAIGLGVYFVCRPKRVFTGSLAVVVTHNENTIVEVCKNMIEFGSKATLETLVAGSLGNVMLPKLTLYPCPKSPSHLPKLLIRNKNKDAKFIVNFTQLDDCDGFSIGIGGEAIILVGDVAVKLRYN